MTKAVRRLFLLSAVCVVAATFTGSATAGEVVGRCGRGYLERTDSGGLVLHVKGTPYEMGFQQGTLLKADILDLIHYLFDVKGREATLKFLGMEMTAKKVVQGIFRLQRRYIPTRYLEEMQGIADAIGLDVQEVYAANSIPELFHCSGFALLKEATDCGTLLHGRVLDYAVDWNLQAHAVLVVAEPDGLVPFCNVTYAGFIGSVTGMNRKQVSIGEMGGAGAGKWSGTPMAFLVRRVLEEADDLDEAIAIFRDTPRTCEYYYVMADAKSNRAVGMEGGADVFRLVAPGEKHDRLPTPVPNTVLLSAGDRYDNLCRLTRETTAGGTFSIDRAIRLMDAPVAMKSNLHNALMAPGL
ncbi:MAG: C45 family autoproteolytic acyltransferase/hydrolase, partial [Planctomycetia bacterium]